jgi:hypothetical protein
MGIVKRKRKWKYPYSVIDNRDYECYDCGLIYGEGGWADVVVPNEIWEMINPTHVTGSGLLCFNCIVRRLAFVGLEEVPIFIASGPFSQIESVPSWKVEE